MKIFDRRFATELREDLEEDPTWSTDLEAEYSRFVRSEHAPEFFDLCTKGLRESLFWETDELSQLWDKGREEAYLQCFCRQLYNIESYAYDQLQDIQGIHVPRLFAHVSLQTSDKPNEYLDCPGLLLEYIDGFQLGDLAENATPGYLATRL